VTVNWKTAERFVAGIDISVRKLPMPVGGTTGIVTSRQRHLARTRCSRG
jgi:hypothetical protein